MSSELRREIGALCLLAVSLFAAVAMATYREADLIGAQSGSANLCGRAGQGLSRFLLQSFGYAGWIPVLCAGFWGMARLLGRTLTIGATRLIGLWVLLVGSSTLLTDFFGGASDSLPDPGGLVGLLVERWLAERVSLGSVGTHIVLLLLVLISLMLATDFLFYASIRGGAAAAKRWRRRRRALRESGSLEDEPESEADREEPEDEDALEEETDDEDVELLGGGRPSGFSSRILALLAGATPGPVRSAWARLSAFFAGDVPVEAELALEDGTGEGSVTTSARARVGCGPGAAAPDAETEETEEPERVERRSRRSTEATLTEQAEEEAMAFRETGEEEVSSRKIGQRRRSRRKAAKPADPLDAAGRFGSDPVRVAPPPVSTDHPYRFPPLDLLGPTRPVASSQVERHSRECSRTLERTLSSFRIEADVVEIRRGPVVTMYELELAPGTKVDRIRALEDDLAMALKARKVRIVAPLPGKSTVGIEVPNLARETVGLRELLEAHENRNRDLAIPVMLGKDVSGSALIDDLARMPHLLVAGATGSGKSVCLNSIIMSILFTRSPEQVKLILIDPKMVELSSFANIAHLMCPVITDIKRVGNILEWAVEKMEARYDILHRVGVRNIYAFNELACEEVEERLGRPPATEDEGRMAFIVLIVDELADLMMASGKEVEIQITRLAQKSRAVGIHVILATQRPSTNVITGLIKANMPTRISFMVASKIDSRVVLDINGAEKLLGAGDMLYLTPRSSEVVRAQCSYVDDREIRSVVKFVKETCSPEYSRELVQVRKRGDQDPAKQDDLWEEAVRFVLDSQRGSASLLQRRFKVGYTRASRLIDLMFEEGLLGEYKGSQAREVLCSLEEWEERQRAPAPSGS